MNGSVFVWVYLFVMLGSREPQVRLRYVPTFFYYQQNTIFMIPKTHIGNIIIQTLAEKDLSIAWLARQVHCEKSNFYKKLKDNIISKELLFHISDVLHVDFFTYYSKELHSRSLTQNPH